MIRIGSGGDRSRLRGMSAVVLLVVAIAAGTGPGTANEAGANDGPVTFETLLRDANPDLDDLGTITHWTPDGPVTETVTGAEILAQMENLAAGQIRWQEDPAVPLSHGGPFVGVGDMRVAPHTGWRFCDYASLWVWHSGDPGDRILSAEAAPVSPPTPPICDGLFGPSTLWTHVALDLTPDPLYTPGCGAAMVMLPHPIDHASPYGGWACTGTHGTAAGFGHVISFGWAGRAIDHFIGGTATVAIE